jgi:SAM-dependent methyltransferase
VRRWWVSWCRVDSSTEINRASWDERAPAHAMSPGYARDRFIDDPSFLSAVVRSDIPLLGDIRALRGVHLQCHIGTDTISLARLGATMTGIDFSPASLVEAQRLSDELQAGVEFVETDVYDAVAALGGRTFDLVFTGIGALCWLPSISRWAAVVAALLEPGGRLFMREGHPMMWSLDERHADALVVEYDYFERPEPMVFDEQGTYVENRREVRHDDHARVESRAWGDRHRAAEGRHGADRSGRARQRPVGGAAGPNGAGC